MWEKLSCKKVSPTPSSKNFNQGVYRRDIVNRGFGATNSRLLRGSLPTPVPHSAQRCREAYSKVVARRSCAAPRQETQTIAPQTKIRPVGLAAELITASCDNNHLLITLTSDPTANRTTPCYLSGNAGGALYPNMDAAPIVGGARG